MINWIKNQFHNSPDLVIKEIEYHHKIIYIVFIETICSSDRINDYILKGISSFIKEKGKISNLKNYLASPKIVDINKNKVLYYLYNSYSIIILDKNIYAIETRADLDRNIPESMIESNVIGPKDALTENYQKNIGLVKKRIKTNDLIINEFDIGNNTKTKIGLLYLENKADSNLVKATIIKLKNINLDFVIEVSNLRNFLLEKNSLFPLINISERPDMVCKSLFKGKIVIMCDNSPDALILPSYLIEFINPIGDDYSKPKNIFIIKLLRLFCFFVCLFLPALYIALINYNPESIPISLLLNFASQRDGVPAPAIIEAFVMLLLSEILKESDIRFPSSYGGSISILGALILGEAAVSAGLVSPIMIIVMAFTFISSLIFNDLNFKAAIRNYSYLFLLFASLLGLYGIALAIIVLFTRLSSLEYQGYSYLYPFIPYDKENMENELIERNEATK